VYVYSLQSVITAPDGVIAPHTAHTPRAGAETTLSDGAAAAWCVAEQIVLAEQAAEVHFQKMARHGRCRFVLGEAEAEADEDEEMAGVDTSADAWKCELTDDLPAAADTLVGSCVKVSVKCDVM
jgi:hypothetical protein